MTVFYRFLLLHSLLAWVASDDPLPTLYEYYTSNGISSGLSVDQPYFTLNGKNITIYGGAMHYFRVPPQYWRDRLKKLRSAGLNTIETYIPWNLHEPKNGTFDFGDGGTDFQMFLDLDYYLTLAKDEDLLVIVRPGPYICAEWEWGGFPSWLLREEDIVVRTTDSKYMNYVRRYFDKLLPILVKHQFTNGGSIIMVQIENEYGFSSQVDPNHIQQLYDLMKDAGIVELLFTTDGASMLTSGSFPGIPFQTVNFGGSDPGASFSLLENIQPNKPLMDMEFYSGWLDHWSEVHHTVSTDNFIRDYEQVLSYPASVVIYMFHGGTNFGFLNGANNGPGDNSAFQPTTTSYDYDAPLNEGGDYTDKFNSIKALLLNYNPIKTLIPDPPQKKDREVYPTLTINGQLSFSDLIDHAPHVVISSTPLPMELLPINDDSGQSYGYIVYRQENINIPANSVLTITGHTHDDVMILINGVLISNPLSGSADFNNFGYWRLENSNITLTSTDLTGVTLDLVFENWGRVNFGNMFYQFKGLTDDNRVYLNDEELNFWLIYPLEFKKSWTSELSGWKAVDDENDLAPGPGLYKATLTIDEYVADYYKDTFIDMYQWHKGIVIVNRFVLGRYAFIGPQQTLYLPGPFLQHGDNEIIIFEQFTPSPDVKFREDSYFLTP